MSRVHQLRTQGVTLCVHICGGHTPRRPNIGGRGKGQSSGVEVWERGTITGAVPDFRLKAWETRSRR
jgi:hypothetical protein